MDGGLLYEDGVYGTDQKRVVVQKGILVRMVQIGVGVWTGESVYVGGVYGTDLKRVVMQ